jgi:homoserine kinase
MICVAVTFIPGAVRVRAPATSANLGPGFDALGLALALYDDVSARSTEGGFHVDVAGQGAGELPDGEGHLVVRAMLATFDVLGGRPAGLALECVNRIPQARGLGSSSAAIVAGLLGARALVEGGAHTLDDQAILELATSLEGHPDNVAACLYGGLTIAWTEDGVAHAVRRDPAAGVHPVVFVPEHRALTATARKLLPDQVPHADAAANAGRAALLVHALTSDPALLLPATRDWLHQDYRAPAMPASADLVRRLRAAGVPAVISGAGPTVLAFDPGSGALPAAVEGFVTVPVEVDSGGALARVTGF